MCIRDSLRGVFLAHDTRTKQVITDGAEESREHRRIDPGKNDVRHAVPGDQIVVHGAARTNDSSDDGVSSRDRVARKRARDEPGRRADQSREHDVHHNIRVVDEVIETHDRFTHRVCHTLGQKDSSSSWALMA